MKKYALILACLAWAMSSNLHAQGAGGAGGGGAGAGGASGAGAGGTGAIGGTAGGAVGGAGAGTGIGGSAAGAINRPGTTPPIGVRPVNPAIPPVGVSPGSGVNTAVGTPGTGIGTGTGTATDPGTGAIGGVTPGTGATGTGTTGDLATGVTGDRGAGNAGPLATPGTLGTMGPADMTLTQQIRTQLLTGTPGQTTVGSAATGVINPQGLAGVQISANNGVVTLRGRVNSEAERRVLESRIRTMNGVRTVVNGLMVAGPGATTGATGTTTPGGTVIPGPTP